MQVKEYESSCCPVPGLPARWSRSAQTRPGSGATLARLLMLPYYTIIIAYLPNNIKTQT